MSAPPADVVDRLEQLAAHAPASGLDPDELWTHGRRRQRVRLGAALAALVAVGLLGTTATPLLVDRAQRVEPADPADRMVLPDVIRQPGEWEPAFPSAPGRLVAAGVGTRGGWWSSRPALWGVSATSGESRFLDLPDVAAGTDTPALSADGRRLAYWFTDEDVEALPGTREPGSSIPLPPGGVAVVDLATGDIERWDAEAPHGLMSEGLVWAGDVLWWKGGTVESVGEDRVRYRYETHTWDVRTDERRVLEKGTALWDVLLHGARPTANGFVVNHGGVLHVVQGNRVARTMRSNTAIKTTDGSAPALSPDGARVAAVMFHDPDVIDAVAYPVVVSSMAGRKANFRRLGDVTSTAMLGWRSPDEVVIETYRGGDMERVYGASAVDVDTAEVTPLIEFRGNVPSFAADAWTAEVVDAPDAPFAPDPRVVGLGGMVVIVFCVSLVRDLRRRRGHP